MSVSSVATNSVVPRDGPDISIGPVHYPGASGDAASKQYVDDVATGLVPNFISPLHYDPILNEVTVSDASALPIPTSGVVNTGPQSFAGDKTFTGTISVPPPGLDTDAATKKYVDDQVKTATISAVDLPLSLTTNLDTTKTLHIAAASATVTGIVNNAAQQFSGAKEFTSGLTTDVVPAVGDQSTAVVSSAFVSDSTVGLNYEANNAWVSGCFTDRVPTLYQGAGLKVYPFGYNMTSQGTYDCSTGVYPVEASGDYYEVTVGGTIVDPVSGVSTTYNIGDWMVFGGVIQPIPYPLQQILPFLHMPPAMTGVWDASTGVFPAGPALFDTYLITVTGTIDGVVYTAGDLMVYTGSTPWVDIPGALVFGLTAIQTAGTPPYNTPVLYPLYQGTWSAATCNYPAGAHNGYIWEVSHTGYIQGTHYNGSDTYPNPDWILYSDIRWYCLPAASIPLIQSIPRVISTNFTIGPGKIRFTIANDDATAENPQVTRLINAGNHAMDGRSFPAGTLLRNAVGLYLDQANTLWSDIQGTNQPLMYSWVQVSTLLLVNFVVPVPIAIPPYLPGQYFTILNVSNLKAPVSNNSQISMTEMINLISPLNLGPNAVSASDSPSVDLSISIGSGNIWEYMTNVMPYPGVVNRTSPNIVSVPGAVKPVMYGVWRYNSGVDDWHANDASIQLDPTQYNPNGMGVDPPPGPEPPGENLVVVPTDSTYWANYPILYNSAVNLYIWQYPTDIYSTSNDALAHVGKFIRLSSPEFRLLNVVGYVTLKVYDSVAAAYATDLTSAIFSGGEFFNYGVGGTSGGAGGGGGTSGVFQEQQTALVDATYGNAATGQWNNSTKPYDRYDSAASAIGVGDALNTYVVKVSPGTNAWPTCRVKPYVNIDGMTPNSCAISVGAPSYAITLNTSGVWNNIAYSPASICIAHTTLVSGTGMNFDFYTTAPSTTCSAYVYITDVRMNKLIVNPTPPPTNIDGLVTGTLTFKSRKTVGGTPLDSMTGLQLYLYGDILIDGGVVMFENLIQETGYTTNVHSNNVNTVITFHACKMNDIHVYPPAPGTTLTVLINSCIISGTLTIDANTTHVKIDRASINLTTSIVGTDYDVYDDELTSDQRAAIAANASLNGTNPVADQSAMNVALNTKADTINGKTVANSVPPSVNGQIWVRGEDLPAVGSHGAANPIDASLVPTSLPAVSIGGTAANATNAVTVTISSVTPPDTRIANVGSVKTYIQDPSTGLAAHANGLATLDGTGKIPSGQLPAGVLDNVLYMGTFDASTGVYPVDTTKGHYYVANVAGTVSLVYYYVGDWAVYNGTAWDHVTGAQLKSWVGSNAITTLGTITSGTWQSSTKIASSYGGVGDLTGPGMVKVTSGVSSIASHATAGDYVAPDDSTTLAGIKTFTNGLRSGETVPYPPSYVAGTDATKVITASYIAPKIGAANGIATLDASGKLLNSQIPAALVGGMVFQGTWDPSTAAYPSASPTNGQYWIASFTTPPYSYTFGGFTWRNTDWIVYSGSSWTKIDNENVESYLSTWVGSTALTTLGTITTGVWQSSTKIGSSYGGVGDLTGPGIVKVSSGVSSIASHATAGDYVAPDDSTTLAGVKTFTNGLRSGETIAFPDNTTKVPSTSYLTSNYAYLSGGTVPTSQLPTSVLNCVKYLGTWDFVTHTGSFPSSPVPVQGVYYVASNAATQQAVDGVYYSYHDIAVYNGSTWDHIDGAQISQFTGNTHIATVGTITSGTWNGAKVASSYGGVGDLIGAVGTPASIVKVSSTGVSGIASAGTDYLTPDNAPVTTRATTDSSTWAASTAFVQAAANLTTPRVFYVNQTNGNNSYSGLTPNFAVKTFAQALSLCITPSSSNLYIIRCSDITSSEVITLVSWVGLEASSTTFTGNLTVNPDSYMRIRQCSSNTVTYGTALGTGAIVTDPSVFEAIKMSAVTVTTTAAGTATSLRYLSVKQLDLTAMNVNNNTDMILRCDKLSGTVNVASGGYLDATGVADFTINTTTWNNSGTIKYPTSQIGGLGAGLVKSVGSGGTFQLASAGTDFVGMATSPTMSGSNDVTIGGNWGALTATIGANKVTLHDMVQQTGPIVLGISSAGAADISALTLSTSSSANSVAYRDASGNISTNHAIDGYKDSADLTATAGHTYYQLVSTDAANLQVLGSGAIAFSIYMPNVTTLPSNPSGYGFTVINTNNATLTITTFNNTGVIGTLPQNGSCKVYSTSVNNSSTTGTWNMIATLATLTGDVTGSLSATNSATISTTISGLSLSKLQTIGANTYLGSVAGGTPTAISVGPSMFGTISDKTVVANYSGSTAVPTEVAPVYQTGTAANYANTLVSRDPNFGYSWGNGYFSNILPVTAAGGTTTLSFSCTTIYVTGTNTQIVKLPAANTSGAATGITFYIINDCGLGSSYSIGTNYYVTVYDNSSNTLIIIRPGERVKLCLTDTSSAAGVWAISPNIIFGNCGTNLWTTGTTTSVPSVSGGSNLTVANLFSGPVSSSGGTLYLPVADTAGASNFITQLVAILGYVPPIGFHFTSYIIHTSSTSLYISSDSDTNIKVYGSTSGDSTSGDVINLIIWLTQIIYSGGVPNTCKYSVFSNYAV